MKTLIMIVVKTILGVIIYNNNTNLREFVQNLRHPGPRCELSAIGSYGHCATSAESEGSGGSVGVRRMTQRGHFVCAGIAEALDLLGNRIDFLLKSQETPLGSPSQRRATND